MKGSIVFHKKLRRYYVSWHHKGKNYKIYRYIDGQYLYDEKRAEKLRALMQSDVERGVFQIERYLRQYTDTVPYLTQWLEDVKPGLSPATYKDYSNSLRNHLIPFFEQHPFQLHEIRYDLLKKLLNSIERAGKGKANVMYCLRACLDFAWRSGRIPSIPPFPKKNEYDLVEPAIEWVSEYRQMEIIEAIPEQHRPIFLWLKYHLRRPSEAMALLKEDYDSLNDVFIVRRSISADTIMTRTKTGAVHVIPCHSEFQPVIAQMPKTFSPFFFSCPTSRQDGKRYSRTIMSRIWKEACGKVGENISLYAGLKHSSCSQYINEKGLSISDLQAITDHARLESVKRYAKTEVARKRELMERKVIKIEKSRQSVGRDGEKKSQ